MSQKLLLNYCQGTLDLLDDAVDFCQPNIIFVSNGSHRALKKLLKAENESTETIESFGKRVIAYSGVPIHVSYDLGEDELLMVKFSEDGVHGVTNSGLKVYEKESGVFHTVDTELLYAVVCKTKNSFSKVEFTVTKSK